MTFAAFEHRMDRLGGLKFKPVSLQTHWEALRDLADAELDAAIARAQREADEFPSPKMLRAFVDEVRMRPTVEPAEDRSVPVEPTTIDVADLGLKIPVTREWRYYCEDCRDTGMRALWCGPDKDPSPFLGRAKSTCERRKEHGSHEFVVECPCASSNPDVQRRKARDQQVKR